jgi:hypothetical protein
MDLCAMKFANSMKLLLDQNIWIADTYMTVHATPNPNPSDMIKKSEKECTYHLTMGNWHSEATLWYGE